MAVNLESLVRRSAASHGLGVFTTRPIRQGQAVFTMSGRVVPAARVSDDMRAMQVGPDEFLVEEILPGDRGDEPRYLDNYVNHGCEPNLGFIDGSLTLVALRDIAADEELLWDYSTSMNEPGWSVLCRCGATRCRGKIQSFCDLSAAERERLLPIALGYLRAMYGRPRRA